jgi:signal transduction histidine kinase
MLSFTTESPVGEPFRSAVRREDRPRFDMLFEAAHHRPATAEIRLRGPLRGRHVLASLRWLESEADAVIVALLTDLTERKKTEKALEAERLANSILEQTSEAILVCDTAGMVIRAARSVKDLAHRNPLFQRFDDILELSTADGARWLLRDHLHETEPIRRQEVTLARKDGEPSDLLMSVDPLWTSEDGLIGVVITMVDVTTLKATEHALRRAGIERAAEEERSRLARDLHDSVTQALFAATLKADALTIKGMVQGRASAVVEDVARLNRGALAQMRTMLLELRGQAIQEVPIGQLLRTTAEATEGRSSVKVNLTIEGHGPLPDALHVAVYRITQEALNNVAKHARAKNAWVRLSMTESLVSLVVQDDGCGYEPGIVDPSHMGLASIEERAREAKAQLLISTALGEGTVLTLTWRPPSTHS